MKTVRDIVNAIFGLVIMLSATAFIVIFTAMIRVFAMIDRLLGDNASAEFLDEQCDNLMDYTFAAWKKLFV